MWIGQPRLQGPEGARPSSRPTLAPDLAFRCQPNTFRPCTRRERKRRSMAEQMIPTGAAADRLAATSAELQVVIEAVDRAISDEEQLPEGYVAAESDPVAAA